MNTQTILQNERVAPPYTNGKATIPALESGDQMSRAEFEYRYHLHPEIRKAELIEGEVYVASPVRAKQHADPHFLLNTWLGVYCAATPGLIGSDNATLRLDLDNEPQPDIMLRFESAYGGKIRISEDDYLEGTPELTVEVAASSASYDLGKKKRVYARNGVKEYIVFATYEKEVYWFVLGEEGYKPLISDADGIIRSQIFPGLWLQTTALQTGDLTTMLTVLQQALASPEHAAFVERLNQYKESQMQK